MNTKSSFFNVRNLTGIGIFAALAAVVSLATSFLKIYFLSLDAGDIVVLLASFIYGSPAGVVISAIASLIGSIYSGTGAWGLLMDFVSSAAFVFVASFIYSRRRDFKSAIIGIGVSVLTTTAIMLPLNRLITPLFVLKYFGNDLQRATEYVVSLIPVFLLPFNFAKTLFNGSVALLVYKPVVRAMRAARLAPPSAGGDDKPRAVGGARPTVVALILGGIALVVAVGGLVTLSAVYGFKVERPW